MAIGHCCLLIAVFGIAALVPMVNAGGFLDAPPPGPRTLPSPLKPRVKPHVGGRAAGAAGRKLLSSVTRVWLFGASACGGSGLADVSFGSYIQDAVNTLNPQVGPMTYKGPVYENNLQDPVFVQQIDLLMVFNCEIAVPVWSTDTEGNVTKALKNNVIWQMMIWDPSTSTAGAKNIPSLDGGQVIYEVTNSVAAVPGSQDISNNADTGIQIPFPLSASPAYGYITPASFQALPSSGGGKFKYLSFYDGTTANYSKLCGFAYTVGKNNPLNVWYSTISMYDSGFYANDKDLINLNMNVMAMLMSSQ